jgi:hypothetical protein
MKGDKFRYTRAALVLRILAAFCLADSAAASAELVWQKCLGGSDYDEAYSIQQTPDGGYIVAGYTWSNDGDVSGNHGRWDYWLVKLDGSGNIIWQKCLGGGHDEEAYSVQQTADGGYIVAGYSKSNDGDVSGNHGLDDYWVVRLDGSGNIIWQKCLGGSRDEEAYSVQQTADGGYIVAGWTFSDDGDVSGWHGQFDYWVVKLDGSGNIIWQKCLGGINQEDAHSVQQTADGGYIVVGSTWSNDGDVSGNHGYSDYWLVKLDGSGNIDWQKCLGGSSRDIASSVKQTTDGRYVVAGYTYSNLTGDVGHNHGSIDYWVAKLSEFDPELMDSYERLLRSQARLIGSFENLLKNTTLDSTLTYKFLYSFDDLSAQQQINLYSFEDLVSHNWIDLNDSRRIELTNSYEDLLRRQVGILTSNEDLFKRGFCKMNYTQKKDLLHRFEARLEYEVVLYEKFEDWLNNQQMVEVDEYQAWTKYLDSFEDLLRGQSSLLGSFELLMKIDCTSTYLTLNKSALPPSANAGDDVTYNYTINATGSYDIKNIVVKDSLWGELGQKDLLKSKDNYTISITRSLTCADCNSCRCKVCNFATACGEVITPNGNFTACVVNDAPDSDKCVIVSENLGVFPIYPGKNAHDFNVTHEDENGPRIGAIFLPKIAETTAGQATAAEEAQTESAENVTAEVVEKKTWSEIEKLNAS